MNLIPLHTPFEYSSVSFPSHVQYFAYMETKQCTAWLHWLLYVD